MGVVPTDSKTIMKLLEKAGFEKVSQKGSHIKMKHPDGRVTIVPHPKKDLPLGTAQNILRLAQIKI